MIKLFLKVLKEVIIDKITKTIKASVINLTKHKQELLDSDYNNYQWWIIFGIDNGLLSAFKSKKDYKQKIIKYKEYPLPLDSRFIKDWFRVKDTKLTKTWIKIPNSKRKGQGVWLPLKFHREMPNKYKLKDSFLIKKNNKYYIYFTIEIEAPREYKSKNIIGIDLGLKNPITLVNINTKQTKFLGKELKQIRGKYFYLRKKLGQENKLKQIKKIKDKEKRKIHSELHKLSRQIVNEAYTNRSAIVIGELNNLKKNKGRKFNRKLNSFSHFKLTKLLEYKCQEKGVPFIKVNEAYTSKTCHVCNMIGTRVKNWFKCSNCKYEDNADRNGAINIGKLGSSYMFGSGVNAFAQKPNQIRQAMFK